MDWGVKTTNERICNFTSVRARFILQVAEIQYWDNMKSNCAEIHDDDAADIIVDVENVFAVHISNEEAETIRTFGDLFDVISNKLPFHKKTKCHSQMAFYQFRNAIFSTTLNPDLKPSTSIQSLISGSPKFRNTKQFSREIQEASGLKFSVSKLSHLGLVTISILLILSLLGLILAVVGYPRFCILSAASLPFIALTSKLDPGRLSDEELTLGDLAKNAAQANYGKFAKRGGRHNETTLWQALSELITSWSGSIAIEELNRETKLLASSSV